jgi:hypothetical protein
MIAGALALLLGLLAAGCNGELVGGGQTPSRVLVVSGDLQTAPAGEELAQPLVARVVDDRNRPVKNQLVNFVVISGGGSVFAGAALTNADGEARERWRLGTVAGDTQRVEARAVDPSTGAPIVFATFRAVATAAAPAQVAAENPDRTGTAGAALGAPLVVRVTDAKGNGVPGTAVTWTVTAGGGTVQANGTTDATGRAQAAWTLGSLIGTPQRVQAAAAGLPPVQFTAMAAPAAPLELVQVGGEYQGAGLGQPLEHPIVLQLRGANGGQPVAGAWVHAGPGASPDSAQTDAQGRASFTWTLVSTAGWQTQVFAVPGTGARADVTAYASERVPARMELLTTIPYWFPGATLNTSVAVYDAAGQQISPFPLRVTVEAGGGSVVSTALGTFMWTMGPNDGTVQRVRVEAGGVDLVVEKQAHRVWLVPPTNPSVTSSTVLRVRGSAYDLSPNAPPAGDEPTMTVTVDGRTTELKTQYQPGLGYYPWMAGPEWISGLAPGAKVARFRLVTTNGTFELDWPFTYQP